jgi:hypothetical protein
MDSLLEKIFEWIRQGLIESIMGSFTGMFDTINQKVGEIAGQVGQTPEAFNSGVFSMIRNLSETAVLPIAGMILTFVMCYELITMITEKNNMHDFDTFNLYKWVFKTFVAVYIVTHTFDIVMGVFELAQSVVNRSAGIISGSVDVGAGVALDMMRTELEAMGVWELIGLWFEMNIIGLCLQAISVCIFLVIFGRMLEIYLTVSVAPIPLSTMANREWGQMGNNYLKSLFALAFQGFLIMVCVAIYAVLVQSIPAASSIHEAIWGTAGYTILLCFTLFKTGSLSKALFGAH